MKTKRLFLNIILVMSVVSVYSQDFTEKIKLVAPDRSAMDQFGNSVSISDSYAIIGAYYDGGNAEGQNVGVNAGSAYIFERDGSGNWNQGQKISGSDVTNGDNFGCSVARVTLYKFYRLLNPQYGIKQKERLFNPKSFNHEKNSYMLLNRYVWVCFL